MKKKVDNPILGTKSDIMRFASTSEIRCKCVSDCSNCIWKYTVFFHRWI